MIYISAKEREEVGHPRARCLAVDHGLKASSDVLFEGHLVRSLPELVDEVVETEEASMKNCRSSFVARHRFRRGDGVWSVSWCHVLGGEGVGW